MPPSTDQILQPRVVVVASSVEGIDAMARLIHQLPATFPVPIVVYLHGLKGGSLKRLAAQKWRTPAKLQPVLARAGENIDAGAIYLVFPEEALRFVAAGVLGPAATEPVSSVDDFFESAARWYRSGVIGVVLSGLGADGTRGLLAITQVDGVRVIQTPFEAIFPAMPLHALLGDHVQYAVLLDKMGKLLMDLVADPTSVKIIAPDIQAEVDSLVMAAKVSLTKSLDRSVEDILQVIREDLSMDVTFVTKQAGDDVVVSHATTGPGQVRVQGMSHPKHQSLCQRVLDGRLPALMPDVESLRRTHDVPVLPIPVGAYMATPIWLHDGTLYGMLCCLYAAASRELDQRHYQRLQMSARQIARLVDDAGEK